MSIAVLPPSEDVDDEVDDGSAVDTVEAVVVLGSVDVVLDDDVPASPSAVPTAGPHATVPSAQAKAHTSRGAHDDAVPHQGQSASAARMY